MICLVANKWLVSRGMSHHPSKEHCVIIYLAVMDKRICLDRFSFGLWHHCLVHLRMLGGLASGIVIHICFATADLLPCRIQHLNCYTACTWIPTIMNLPFKTIEMNDELHKTSNHRNQCNEDADRCCFMLWRNPQCSFTAINTVIIHNLTGNSHYATYFMFNLCFWVCFRSKNSCDVWGLKWNQCLRVLSYSFGKWLCDMLNFLFLFTETHVSCGSWQENIPRVAERPYWSDKLSCITMWGDVFKNTMCFLPGWAVKLFSGVIIKHAFCSGELKDIVTWGVIRRGRRHSWRRVSVSKHVYTLTSMPLSKT